MRLHTARLARVLLGLVMLLPVSVAGPAHAVTISIVNQDGPGEGFNDATPAAPVGGNPGTTVGQQRLNVFQEAAGIWGALLPGSATIEVNAAFNPLTCTATSAVLGSAGATQVFRDFSGAPVAGHWFSIAEANKITGSDMDPASAEISATFNANLGQTGCLDGSFFYYGYDGNEGTNIDLLAVLLHELGHGLGFQTYTNGSTGSYVSSYPSIWDKFLLDTSTGLHWNQMTALQRKASALNGGKLVWDGPAVTMAAPSFLGPRTVMAVNSPAGIAGTYGAGTASFGPPLDATGITGDVVLAIDGTSPLNDGCEVFTNAAQIAGKIALIDRGLCTFVVKVKNAQNAGAIAAIIVDNTASAPAAQLGGTDPTITIPSVRVTLADGNLIKANLPGVNVTLRLDTGGMAGADNAGRVMMFAPNPYQSGSSVSHFETSASPNLLMEPSINTDLNASSNPYLKVDLTLQSMADIGWFGPAAGVNEARSTPDLLANAPNPFASSTAIRFELARDEVVDLAIYDVGGRLVKQLARGSLSRGPHVMAWDGRNSEGRTMASGVYLYRLKSQGSEQTQRMILFR